MAAHDTHDNGLCFSPGNTFPLSLSFYLGFPSDMTKLRRLFHDYMKSSHASFSLLRTSHGRMATHVARRWSYDFLRQADEWEKKMIR